jgi:hypothetical protein
MSDTLYASEIEFVNLTDHEIRLGDGLVIPKAARPARVLNGRRQDGSVVLEESDEVIPIYRFDPRGQIVGLPDPRPGLFYIVSPILRRELTQRGVRRPDVFSPYAIEQRSDRGRRVPCATALAR